MPDLHAAVVDDEALALGLEHVQSKIDMMCN
jgi:hypothetical protein